MKSFLIFNFTDLQFIAENKIDHSISFLDISL